MAENYGGLKNAYLLIGKQSAIGTPVVPAKDTGIVTEGNFNGSNEVIKDRGWSSRSLSGIQMGNWNFKGDYTGDFQHGRLIEYALGAVAHSGSSDPYTHTFTEAQTIPAFTAETGLDGTTDDVERYQDCKINSYTLALDLGGKLTQRAEILATKMAPSTTSQAAVTSTLPTLPWAVAQFKTGASGSETAIGQCRSFEWTINNNLARVEGGFGSYFAEDHLEGERDYTAKVTMAFRGPEERSKFLTGTTGATGPATADFDGFSTILDVQKSASRLLTLTLTDCHYAEYNRPISVSGQILQDFTIEHRTAGIVTKDNISEANW